MAETAAELSPAPGSGRGLCYALLMDKNPFEYQAPTPENVQQITDVREALKAAHAVILERVPPSRERSLAITKLEECSMWANKGIVFN